MEQFFFKVSDQIKGILLYFLVLRAVCKNSLRFHRVTSQPNPKIDYFALVFLGQEIIFQQIKFTAIFGILCYFRSANRCLLHLNQALRS